MSSFHAVYDNPVHNEILSVINHIGSGDRDRSNRTNTDVDVIYARLVYMD